MANIVKYLEKILSSRYGEDVRGSIHDSIKAINDEVIDYGAEAGLKAEEAAENANLAKTYAEAAAESKESAQISANSTLQNLAEVKDLAQEAKTSAEDAETQAELSRSYAVGTNGEAREGDEQDNAKYYKEQAELKADAALQSANLASQKADKASLSEANAGQYALNASSSEANAKASEENAKKSEEAAQQSESDALQNAVASENSAKEAIESAEAASKSEANASTYEAAAKNYAESAAESANRAETVANISFATQEKAGIVKPDGTTITVDGDGTLHGTDTVEVDGQTIEKTEDNVLKVADAVLNRLDGLSDSNETLSEYVSERVDGIWDQFGKVDNELDKLKYNTETTFGEASERENIASGERMPVILGKIRKWFSDLKAVAFTGSYNDLTDKPVSLPANGGNADTVGNISPTEFYRPRQTFDGNIDELHNSNSLGTYWCIPTTLGTKPPEASYFDLLVFTEHVSSDTGAVQIAVLYWGNGVKNKVYIRNWVNGIWAEWSSLTNFVSDSGRVADRILVTDSYGNVQDGGLILASELIYLQGIRENIQNKLSDLSARSGYIPILNSDWSIPSGNQLGENYIRAFISNDSPYVVEFGADYKLNGQSAYPNIRVNRAYSDQDGNNIKETYAKKSEIQTSQIKVVNITIHSGGEGEWEAWIGYKVHGFLNCPSWNVYRSNNADFSNQYHYDSYADGTNIVIHCHRQYGNGNDSDTFNIHMVGI